MPSYEESVVNQERRRRLSEYGGDICECECGSNYFEVVEAQQSLAFQPLSLGTKPMPRPGTFPFVMLRCVCCGKYTEPNVLRSASDKMNDVYNDFLNLLDKHKLLSRGSSLEE
jgi:hypothetical protein